MEVLVIVIIIIILSNISRNTANMSSQSPPSSDIIPPPPGPAYIPPRPYQPPQPPRPPSAFDDPNFHCHGRSGPNEDQVLWHSHPLPSPPYAHNHPNNDYSAIILSSYEEWAEEVRNDPSHHQHAALKELENKDGH